MSEPFALFIRFPRADDTLMTLLFEDPALEQTVPAGDSVHRPALEPFLACGFTV